MPPFDGNGVYNRPATSVTPAVASTTIESADFNTFTADLATALTNCITKDGQTTVTANLPMATYRHTGVGDAAALTDYASANQVIDNALCYGGASAAGTDDYAVDLPINPGGYVAGQVYSFIADVANTNACAVNFNNNGAKAIKTQDGANPASNVIKANSIVVVQYDGTNFILLSPAGGAIVGSLTGNVTGNLTGDVTGNLNGALTGPAFRASKDTTGSPATPFPFNTESFDTASDYDNATNYRFTPSTAGLYLIDCSFSLTVTTGGSITLNIRRNGSTVVARSKPTTSSTIDEISAQLLVDMNGSTDYVDISLVEGSGTHVTGASTSGNHFEGVLVRGSV